MDLEPHVLRLRDRLTETAALGGEEARDLVDRLSGALEATFRLALQDLVAAAADEIALELAPGSVDVRLRGDELEFVVETGTGRAPAPAPETPDTASGTLARINLRLPEDLKSRVEQLATREGLSTNSWLVRATAAAAERSEVALNEPAAVSASRAHLTGWVR
ncbi:MAG TPA: ribbon-helix-helix protein, CopG family [Cellulomonas sp.]